MTEYTDEAAEINKSYNRRRRSSSGKFHPFYFLSKKSTPRRLHVSQTQFKGSKSKIIPPKLVVNLICALVDSIEF